MSWKEMYDILNEKVGLSEKTLNVIFAINGCNTTTAENILFYYTGWRNFEKYLDFLEIVNEK